MRIGDDFAALKIRLTPGDGKFQKALIRYMLMEK